MKILVDTNILIHLEDNKVIDETFSKFYNLAISNNCHIFYHPFAVPEDILRDKNDERRNIILSKLGKYQKLNNPAVSDQFFQSQLKNNCVNDQCDNEQLYQVYRNFVDLFITQDNGIHTKAQKLGLNNKVLNVQVALEYLKSIFTIVLPTHPVLKGHSIRELEPEFNQSFFDSLREDYNQALFDNWLLKCVIDDRQCYSVRVQNDLIALLIYKVENVGEHQIPALYENVLKICTLKVADNAFGLKLGELFINKMFEYCINQCINYLYLTVYEKQDHLRKLLNKLGFQEERFINKQGVQELRLLKCLDKSKITLKENNILIHPYYFDGEEINKYVVPIRPEFYGTLFKDGKLRYPTLFDEGIDSLNEIQGNTIIKAYISNSRITSLKMGDLLLFYSSRTDKVIEPIGVLESAQRIDDFEELWKIVQRKTVFSRDKLYEWFCEKKSLHVITFRLITYLKKKIQYKNIQQLDSFKNKLQSITKLKECDYQKLKKDGYFDERYIIN
ncbi:GNAT family N-acetyltransferase [Culturomica massiliensis]|uniref:GNAT family N-acetyltransferase n=1 Tax=Culturomica massiliensis TaxID=1841857 RepID=UPI000838D7A8|nr:GNAT family N-acetyltransferase [Culturomica massiliensis]